MSEFVSHTFAAGLTNSAAIHKVQVKDTVTQNLFVWGENSDERIFEKPRNLRGINAADIEVIRQPKLIKLMYMSEYNRKMMEMKGGSKWSSIEYVPIEVACGPSNIWAIGRIAETTFVGEAFEDNNEVKEILNAFKIHLLKDKTLIKFLGLNQ